MYIKKHITKILLNQPATKNPHAHTLHLRLDTRTRYCRQAFTFRFHSICSVAKHWSSSKKERGNDGPNISSKTMAILRPRCSKSKFLAAPPPLKVVRDSFPNICCDGGWRKRENVNELIVHSKPAASTTKFLVPYFPDYRSHSIISRTPNSDCQSWCFKTYP